jgi:hypothetical protein
MAGKMDVKQSDIDALMDMFGPEDLHPDLVHRIEERGNGHKVLHHPLIIEPMYMPQLHKRINLMYAQKTAALEEAIAARNWPSYVYLHERPYRFDALTTVIYTYLDGEIDAKGWDLIGGVWVDSENIYQNLEDWECLWDGTDLGDRKASMSKDEQKAFKALPPVIDVWRGFAHDEAMLGMSWTTDKERAIWFAKRFAADSTRKPMLASGRVKKKHVFAHFLGRNESEIVTLGEYVDGVTMEKL